MPGRRTTLATELSVFVSWEYFPATDVPSTLVYVLADHIVGLIALIGFQDMSGRRVGAQIGQLDAGDVLAFVLKLQRETALLNSTGTHVVSPSGGQIVERRFELVILVLTTGLSNQRQNPFVGVVPGNAEPFP